VRLAISSLDRLVEFVEEHGGRAQASEAVMYLLALRRAPERHARLVLGPLVDQDARLEWRGSCVALARSPARSVEEACFVVFDLETTGLVAGSAQICEIGAIRVQRLVLGGIFETLVSPAAPLGAPTARLTGLSDEALRGAPRIATALRRFCAFAGDSVLVAHNARFDVGFINRELEQTGQRLAGTVIDTLPLARNLLRGRVDRVNLSSLAFFFGVSVEPCHRALPDAVATAEVFRCLIGLARENGASTVAELQELAVARTQPRRRNEARPRRLQ
jgi:DNA polymerase III epsilon subunit family exonuclease